jgi:hypothetical protein
VESIAEQLPPVYSWLRKAGADPLAVDGKPLDLQETGPERIAG